MRPDPRFPPTKHWEVLIVLVRKHGWTRGAEIGVLKGRCLFALLDACPELSMVAVDQWRHLELSDEPGAEHYRAHDMAACAELVKRRARDYGARCQIIHAAQDLAANFVNDGALDFVFLDADHTTPGTLVAIESWRPKVRRGGALLGHDWECWPSVRAALDMEFGEAGWSRLQEQVWRVDL